LSAIAAAGLAGCSGGDGGDGGEDGDSGGGTVAATAPSEWPSVDDDYYSGLVSELSEEMGLAPGRFLYADNEADALEAYTLSGDAAEQFELDVSADVPFSSAVRVDVTEET
jgi:hypothetical protein